jgi:hypothetical protein
MANDTTGNPWSLDTAGVIQTRPLTIKSMEWNSPTTDTHTLDVTDNAGHKIWAKTAIAGGSGIDYAWEKSDVSFKGFNLVTIDSGTLYVYVE